MQSPPQLKGHEPAYFTQPTVGSEDFRPGVHPLEQALIGVTTLHLCFLPWALGAMHPWSQLTSLGLAFVGLLLAAYPRNETQNPHGQTGGQRWRIAQLSRSPCWWLGLLFLGYLAVQALNPAYRFFSDSESWWLEPINHVPWLPSSVDAPFERGNPWRSLSIFTSLFLLVSSVWAGFSRRKSYHILFSLLAANAGLLAMFGLIQRLSGTTEIFGSIVSSNDAFAASFIYPNHAGAYLNLIISLAIGLAWWHGQRARRQHENPGPAIALLLVAVCCGSMVITSNSRTAITLLLAFILLIIGGLSVRFWQRSGPVTQRPEFLYLVLAISAIFCAGIATINSDKAWKRFSELAANPTSVARDRILARQAGEEMLHDHWLLGWGAGCFRYGFTKYTAKYPAIHFTIEGERTTWEHLHDDLLEFPIEFGAIGLLPVLGIFCCAGWELYRRRFWRNVIALALVLGCALVFAHTWVDFIFQNPAVLLTWSVLLAGAVRWAELDQPRGRKLTGNRASEGHLLQTRLKL